jgi:hypothetical protein
MTICESDLARIGLPSHFVGSGDVLISHGAPISRLYLREDSRSKNRTNGYLHPNTTPHGWSRAYIGGRPQLGHQKLAELCSKQNSSLCTGTGTTPHDLQLVLVVCWSCRHQDQHPTISPEPRGQGLVVIASPRTACASRPPILACPPTPPPPTPTPQTCQNPQRATTRAEHPRAWRAINADGKLTRRPYIPVPLQPCSLFLRH